MGHEPHHLHPDRAATLARAMAPTPHGIREHVGHLIGRVWAPGIAAISRARHARMFHPRGITFDGFSEAVLGGPFAVLGSQLEGRVLVRCSAALSKRGREYFDVLGMAIRIRPGDGPELDEHPTINDQDLLFATIRSPLTMLVAPFVTDASDFVGNRYWAVSPFVIHEGTRIELRLSPVDPHAYQGTRDERLRKAVADGRAAWFLEARKTLTLRWHRVTHVTLEAEVAVDQGALRFDPFRAGCGVVPAGLVHAIRRATYAASQRARPHHEPTS